MLENLGSRPGTLGMKMDVILALGAPLRTNRKPICAGTLIMNAELTPSLRVNFMERNLSKKAIITPTLNFYTQLQLKVPTYEYVMNKEN